MGHSWAFGRCAPRRGDMLECMDKNTGEASLSARTHEGAQATRDVYGMLIFLLQAHQDRLAKDAALAPDIFQQIELNRMSAAAWTDCARVMEQCAIDGTTVREALESLDGLSYGQIETRLRPGDWWERVVKTYVTIGAFSDYQSLVASNVSERYGTIPAAIVESEWSKDHERWTIELLKQAEKDPKLAPRLSLWGRRVLGDVIHLLSQISLRCPAMFDASDARGELRNKITALHNERMQRAGLAG